MASFESKAVKQTSALLEVKKFSLQRLEISVNKFIKVITIDIDRLQQHRLNVEKVRFLSSMSLQLANQLKHLRLMLMPLQSKRLQPLVQISSLNESR